MREEEARRELIDAINKNKPTLRPITLENHAAVFIIEFLLIHPDQRSSCTQFEEMAEPIGISNISPTLSGLAAWHILDNKEGLWFLSEPAREIGFKLEHLNDFTHRETNEEWVSFLKKRQRRPIDTQVIQILSNAIKYGMACGLTTEEIHEIVNERKLL
jgi:hypothetical protein